MQKIRMILSAFCVVAIVGSALAFVPKSNSYCVRASTSGGTCTTSLKCTSTLTNVTSGSSNYYCTATVPGGGCTANTACTSASPVNLDNQTR